MSEQEQDAIVGRLIREKAAAMRHNAAALDAELHQVVDIADKVLH